MRTKDGYCCRERFEVSAEVNRRGGFGSSWGLMEDKMTLLQPEKVEAEPWYIYLPLQPRRTRMPHELASLALWQGQGRAAGKNKKKRQLNAISTGKGCVGMSSRRVHLACPDPPRAVPSKYLRRERVTARMYNRAGAVPAQDTGSRMRPREHLHA